MNAFETFSCLLFRMSGFLTEGWPLQLSIMSCDLNECVKSVIGAYDLLFSILPQITVNIWHRMNYLVFSNTVRKYSQG